MHFKVDFSSYQQLSAARSVSNFPENFFDRAKEVLRMCYIQIECINGETFVSTEFEAPSQKTTSSGCFDVCSWTKNAPVLCIMCYVSFCFRYSDQSVGHVGSKITLAFRDFLDNGWLNPDRSKTFRLIRVCSIDLAGFRGQKSRSQNLVSHPTFFCCYHVCFHDIAILGVFKTVLDTRFVN